jgi:hypothetical protein
MAIQIRIYERYFWIPIDVKNNIPFESFHFARTCLQGADAEA